MLSSERPVALPRTVPPSNLSGLTLSRTELAFGLRDHVQARGVIASSIEGPSLVEACASLHDPVSATARLGGLTRGLRFSGLVLKWRHRGRRDRRSLVASLHGLALARRRDALASRGDRGG